MRLYEWFESKNHIYLIMELCNGGELFEKIGMVGHFNESVAVSLFQQMMRAVNHCYSKKICHKDLKPENFMFLSNEADSCIKLIDFGLSQIFSDPSNPLSHLARDWLYKDEGEGRKRNPALSQMLVAILCGA